MGYRLYNFFKNEAKYCVIVFVHWEGVAALIVYSGLVTSHYVDYI